MTFIMVLEDGTTYTGLDGCEIVRIPDHLDIHEDDYSVAEIKAEGGKVIQHFRESENAYYIQDGEGERT